MLPCQASSPLRWVLRPGLRLYAQKHSAALGACVLSTPEKSASSTSTLTLARPTADPNPFRVGSSQPFFTSCVVCDAAQSTEDAADLAALKLENGERVKAILGCGSFEELVSTAQKVESAFVACVVLQRLSALVKEGKAPTSDLQDLLQDPGLKGVCKTVDDNIGRLSPKAVLNTLQALHQVATGEVYIVKSLTTQMLWLLRRLPIPMVIQTLQSHLNHQGSSLQMTVVQQCLDVLERRWVELTNPKDIIFLMYVTQGATPVTQGLVDRLEDRALDVVDRASPKELYRIIYLLCRQRHRNTPLIRAVTYHLHRASLATLSAVQLTNLTYALCTLSVFDTPVLAKVSAELRSKAGELTPKLASSLMTSFSRLRWREESVLDTLMDVLQGKETTGKETTGKETTGKETLASSHSPGRKADLVEEAGRVFTDLTSLDAADKAGLVLSLANLNVDTPQSRELVREITGLEDVRGLRESSPLLWLDVVWSLCVLRLADAESVASVLAEDFWGQLPAADSFQSLLHLTKVSNVHCAARWEMDGYTGPLLTTLPTPDAKLLQKGERKAGEKLVKALTNTAPLDTYTLTNTTAPGGYLIDAEFYVDGSGTPRPLSQVSETSADCYRVALKVLDFPDLTLPTSDLTGLHAMAVRHLTYQGYNVVQVKHSEMPSQSKVVELVNFLQQKVKDTLKVKDSPKVNPDSQVQS